jgi:hypothetical protein
LNTFFLKSDVWKAKRKEIDATMTSSKVSATFGKLELVQRVDIFQFCCVKRLKIV